MSEIAFVEKNKRLYFNWVPNALIHPRRAFRSIASAPHAIWLTPLLLLSCLALINVLLAGRLKNQAALTGELSYPANYQYYTPEQQAQYTQAVQSSRGPVFVYILPAITSLLGIWFSWLILGGILHLVTTLLGGRGSTVISMNIVGWGSLPFAIRAFIQIIYLLSTNKLISSPGLSGFSPIGNAGWIVFIGLFLRLLDIYIIWHVLLLILGVRLSTGLNTTKSSFGVIFAVLIILFLQTGLTYLGSVLGNLTITRPFFF